MNRDKTINIMADSQSFTITVVASCLIAMSVPAQAAEKKSRKPQGSMLIGIVEEAHNDHLMIATTMHKREKRKLILNEQSDVYIGFHFASCSNAGTKAFRLSLVLSSNGPMIFQALISPSTGVRERLDFRCVPGTNTCLPIHRRRHS